MLSSGEGRLQSLGTSSSLQTSIGGKGKHEATCSGHHRVGSPIATYERETAAEVHQRQDREVPAVRPYRLHRDFKSFAERLIAIIKPQPRSNLSRAQLDTDLPCTSVDI